MYNGEYELISEYNGAHSKVVIKHNSPVCNYSHYNTAPTDILSGKRCPKCDVINRSGENHWKYNPLLTPQDRMKRDMQNGKIRIWRLKSSKEIILLAIFAKTWQRFKCSSFKFMGCIRK